MHSFLSRFLRDRQKRALFGRSSWIFGPRRGAFRGAGAGSEAPEMAPGYGGEGIIASTPSVATASAGAGVSPAPPTVLILG